MHNLKRIPQQVNFQKALNGKPGPVWTCPGDVLYAKIGEAEVDWSYLGRPIVEARPYAEDPVLHDPARPRRFPIPICRCARPLSARPI